MGYNFFRETLGLKPTIARTSYSLPKDGVSHSNSQVIHADLSSKPASEANLLNYDEESHLSGGSDNNVNGVSLIKLSPTDAPPSESTPLINHPPIVTSISDVTDTSAAQNAGIIPSGLRRFWAHFRAYDIRAFKDNNTGKIFWVEEPNDYIPLQVDRFEQASDWAGVGVHNGSVLGLSLMTFIEGAAVVSELQNWFIVITVQALLRLTFNVTEAENASNLNPNKILKTTANILILGIGISGIVILNCFFTAAAYKALTYINVGITGYRVLQHTVGFFVNLAYMFAAWHHPDDFRRYRIQASKKFIQALDAGIGLALAVVIATVGIDSIPNAAIIVTACFTACAKTFSSLREFDFSTKIGKFRIPWTNITLGGFRIPLNFRYICSFDWVWGFTSVERRQTTLIEKSLDEHIKEFTEPLAKPLSFFSKVWQSIRTLSLKPFSNASPLVREKSYHHGMSQKIGAIRQNKESQEIKQQIVAVTGLVKGNGGIEKKLDAMREKGQENHLKYIALEQLKKILLEELAPNDLSNALDAARKTYKEALLKERTLRIQFQQPEVYRTTKAQVEEAKAYTKECLTELEKVEDRFMTDFRTDKERIEACRSLHDFESLWRADEKMNLFTLRGKLCRAFRKISNFEMYYRDAIAYKNHFPDPLTSELGNTFTFIPDDPPSPNCDSSRDPGFIPPPPLPIATPISYNKLSVIAERITLYRGFSGEFVEVVAEPILPKAPPLQSPLTEVGKMGASTLSNSSPSRTQNLYSPKRHATTENPLSKGILKEIIITPSEKKLASFSTDTEKHNNVTPITVYHN